LRKSFNILPVPLLTLFLLLFNSLFSPNLIFAQELIWKHLCGPMGGIIGDIAIDSNGDIYAGTYSSLFYWYAGLYKSTDNGETWNKIESLPFDIEVYALFVNKDDYIFAGTRGQGVIYRSTDDGETWEVKSSGYISPHCWAMGQNKDGNVLVAGEAFYGRTFRSTDNGDSWTYTAPLSAISFAVDSINNIYCGTFNGLYKSTDNGLTWEPTGLTNVPVNAILIDSINGVICGSGYYTNGQGVFYSNDYGSTWTNIGLGGQIIYSLAFTSYGSLLAGSGTNGVYETNDMGGNWRQHNNGLYRKDIFRLRVNENDDIITGSEYEGIFRSTNQGESFEHIGLPISRVNNIDFYEDSLIIAATPSGVQKYNRLTEKWKNISLQKVNAVDVDEMGNIYAGTDGEGLFYSSNTGITWSNICQTPYILNVKKANETILAATDTGLIRSTNNGISWEYTPVKSGVDKNAISINSNGDIWAISRFHKLFKSTDGGFTFDSLSLGFSLVDQNNLYVNKDIIFMGDLTVGIGFFYSTDYGNTWENKYHHRTIACTNGNIEYIISGTFKDIIYSTNNFTTLDSIPYPQGFYGYVNEIEFDKNEKLFFGTSSQGLYEMDFIVSVREDPSTVKDFIIYPLYPNPFNSSVTVKYNLSFAMDIEISVYNILGQKVKVINMYNRAGINEEKISFNNLAGGIYLITIDGKDFFAVKKAAYLK